MRLGASLTPAPRSDYASRVGGECEIEVDTSVGWFRVGCGRLEPIGTIARLRAGG